MKAFRHTGECAENPEPFQCSPEKRLIPVPGRVRVCLITGAGLERIEVEFPLRVEPRGVEIRTMGSVPKIQGVSNAVTIGKRWVWPAVIALLVVQAAQMTYVVHRESVTFDEPNHMFAAYMMVKNGDFGLNPEHPPLAKLLAALPLLGQDLWVPQLEGRNFKTEAYLSGRDWLARNDGDTQRIVLKMRLAAGLLALAFSLMVFLRRESGLGRKRDWWRWCWPRLTRTCWRTRHW